ncbi:MAG: glycosyltransferase family 4 protein [Flavobacterium sp.]|nr:glycosyltransferase family 4 protein [Flavobacterium sp.]
MKIIYLTPTTNDAGGVARVLSIKSNYLIEKYKYEVHFITQNQNDSLSFFEFNSNAVHHNIVRKGGKLGNFLNYNKQLQILLKSIQPDLIFICDFGYKGFLIPFMIRTKIPLIFEVHGSIYNESQRLANTFLIKIGQQLKYKLRKFCATKFDAIVVLSNESLKEWNVKKSYVIPNPNWFESNDNLILKNKKVIAVARHSFEKGLDRLLKIWQKIINKHPDWHLEIYGNVSTEVNLATLVNELNLTKTVHFFEPVSDIKNRYLDASIYVMTSRSEGFPMVLIEAMSAGLPIVAYDCPVGPRVLIVNSENGFLIEDGNELEFISKLEILIVDQNLRLQMGKNASESVKKYDIDAVMKLWNGVIEQNTNR